MGGKVFGPALIGLAALTCLAFVVLIGLATAHAVHAAHCPRGHYEIQQAPMQVIVVPVGDTLTPIIQPAYATRAWVCDHD
jgi:predicted RND superfamily exporter protein